MSQVILQYLALDLNDVVPSQSGPKRPQDRIALGDIKSDMTQYIDRVGGNIDKVFTLPGSDGCMHHGDVVIAESCERIHWSNLIGMGVLPRQFPDGVTHKTVKIQGDESFDFSAIDPERGHRIPVTMTINRSDRSSEQIQLECPIDTDMELSSVMSGGILPYVMNELAEQGQTGSHRWQFSLFGALLALPAARCIAVKSNPRVKILFD